MVTCSYNGEDTPDHNQFCFTEAQCGALMGFDAKGNTISQPGRFQTGTSQAHDCPAPLSYCYANKGTPYKLAFPFDPKNTFVIDIGDYINKPVRTYSTGMLMRVAFSVAVAVEPDVLIIDEAL